MINLRLVLLAALTFGTTAKAHVPVLNLDAKTAVDPFVIDDG